MEKLKPVCICDVLCDNATQCMNETTDFRDHVLVCEHHCTHKIVKSPNYANLSKYKQEI